MTGLIDWANPLIGDLPGIHTDGFYL